MFIGAYNAVDLRVPCIADDKEIHGRRFLHYIFGSCCRLFLEGL